MIHKIKNKLLIAASAFMLAVPLAAPVGVAAQPSNVNQDVIRGGLCKGANDLEIAEQRESCERADTATSGFNDLLKRIINIISVIIGVIAVIMIIWGGFKYITSGGAQDKVKGAKDTLLYAIIGLIIVALAQVIVRFVLSNTPGTS